MTYLKASEKDTRDKPNIDALLPLLSPRSEQVSNCKIILFQCKRPVSLHCCCLMLIKLMEWAYGDNSMPYGWFMMCSLKNESFPELRPEEAGKLWAGPPHEECKRSLWLWGCLNVKGWTCFERDKDGTRGKQGLSITVAVTNTAYWCTSETSWSRLVAFNSPYCIINQILLCGPL